MYFVSIVHESEEVTPYVHLVVATEKMWNKQVYFRDLSRHPVLTKEIPFFEASSFSPVSEQQTDEKIPRFFLLQLHQKINSFFIIIRSRDLSVNLPVAHKKT